MESERRLLNVEVDRPFSFLAHTVLKNPKSGERLKHVIQSLRDSYVIQFSVHNASTAAAIARHYHPPVRRRQTSYVVRLPKSHHFGSLQNGKHRHLWAMNWIRGGNI